MTMRGIQKTLKHLDNVLHYPFAGLDFLLDEDLNLVFIEANSVPGGLYVMNCTNRLLCDLAPQLRYYLPGIDFIEVFVDMCICYYEYIRGRRPRRVVVTSPVNRPPLLMPERASIASCFRRRGIDCIISDRSKYFVKSNMLHVRLGSLIYTPDMIIRRNTGFPKGLRQIVINTSETGLITGSKFRTYRFVKRYLDSMPQYKDIFRMPLTHYAKRVRNIRTIAEDMLREGKKVVIKPNIGEGGKNIFFVDSFHRLEHVLKKIDRMNIRSFVIQEMINTYKVRINSELYTFDIRAYGLLGEFIGGHIRLAGRPVGRGAVEDWAISNISRGGMYLPVFFDGSLNIIRWNNKRRIVYPFRHIIVDNHALCLDRKILEKLRLAVRIIVEAISVATNGYRGADYETQEDSL